MEQDCCKQKSHHGNEECNKQEGAKQPPAVFLVIGALLMAAVIVQAYNFTQISQVNSLVEKQATTLSLTGNAIGAMDMSGWTDNEKMNYEMHGIIPAGAQGGATAAAANSGSNTTPTASFSDVSPKGVPRIYGSELGVSFDDVSPNDPQKANSTIAILSQFDKEKSGKFI